MFKRYREWDRKMYLRMGGVWGEMLLNKFIIAIACFSFAMISFLELYDSNGRVVLEESCVFGWILLVCGGLFTIRIFRMIYDRIIKKSRGIHEGCRQDMGEGSLDRE